MGDLLSVASLNALHLVECEKRREGIVKWIDEQATQK